ncbi:hypothetical protein GBA65_07710 [Rubrobacter marinus]|uniref:PRC-barrel domain-containing protein n=1 Tax=Rubrobacter marinus TaxID=2653852 RepID=A0A6G8PW49_9ACTN|nr:PRC-barrel domain-containing protein [Rubrobacter marinus]QIN78429.1 hypothetical protein GBA65_07710 [Rubrobacter marinus]
MRTATDRSRLTDRIGAPEDYVGYGVHDPEGRRIGSVKELFVNRRGEPEYVKLRTGLFGLRTYLLPVDVVLVDEEHRVLNLQ